MSEPVVVTAPTQLPITYDEAMAILKDPPAERGFINECMQSATDHAETYLKRALITRTYDLFLDGAFTALRLPKPPAISVTSVNYYDADNAEQVLATTLYQADTVSQPGVIVLLAGQSWPILVDKSLRALNRVRVRYTAGYGANLSDVPAKIRMGILQLTAHYFWERQTLGLRNMSVLPGTGEALLEPFIHHGG